MQAVILAAGEGKRLRPVTDTIPKALVPVLGTPIVEHTVSELPNRITEVVFVVGYRGDQIKNHFGREFLGIPVRYVEDVLPKGTGYALAAARPHIRGDFLLLNGDDLYDRGDLETVVSSDGPAILAIQSDTPERFGVCLIEEGKLRGIIEKPKIPPGNLVNIGAYFLDDSIFGIPPKKLPNGEWNLAAQVGDLAAVKNVTVHMARFWNPINTLEELRQAEETVRSWKNDIQ